MITLTPQYWAFIGIINLVYLTWQDYTNDRKVDDRKNYFMFGLTFALLAIQPMNPWHFLLAVGIIILAGWAAIKVKVFGEADIKTMGWIILGYTILDGMKLLVFFICLFLVTSLYAVSKFYVFRVRNPTPFYGVLLLTFSFSAWINKIL